MSTILTVENLSRSYGDNVLFEDISFVISQYQKVALIARNGAGKTSLLSIIAGMESADGGTVTLFNKASLGYLKQEPELTSSHTVFNEVYTTSNEVLSAIYWYEQAIRGEDKEQIILAMERMDALNGWEYETRIKQILSRLQIPDLDKRIDELSGGQQKRVALAKVLITEPDFMILDEPTNHLDVEMIEWLEEYLSQRRVTFLMVTHDRYFLDRICNEILELDHTGIHRYRGSYFYFLEKQAERLDILTKETEKAQNLLRKEQEWMQRMPKARTTKAKARIDSFYELKETADRKVPDERMKIHIEGQRMGKKILEVNDLSFSWGEMPMLKGFTFTFKRNEKIGIIGNNGSGKSTFLDLITGKLKPNRGSVKKGETIQFGYYTQEGIPFNPDTKVIDVVREIADVVKLGNGDTISASAFLNYFMFPYPSHHQPVYKLSGGEKRRLYLVTVLMRSPNFLILDEPTNDLDILTLNVLEEYLESFNGCVIIVTHDRYFLDKIVDHLFVFEGNGVVKDFPGNYTQFRDYSERHKRKIKAETKPSPIVKTPNKPSDPNKLTFKKKRELEVLEREIGELESEKGEIEASLTSGMLSADDLHAKSQRFASILRELEEKGERWLELSVI
ncbi:MAG: ABC-F family ATP-binding cassette domain-containing protein [Deltaproteobacteria bacterium]|nr:ABC-F family ATP-binding cassette domain-containing protein [Deltaproteobacteria bacterium]MBL7112700.1 ABC-F family ATP-binding cassette domain-containing protein [Bacteroidales bacterium]